MSDKKIVVPEGMLKAAVDAAWINAHGSPHPQASPKVAKDIEDGIRFDLEASILWLDGELVKMVKGDPYINDMYMRSETPNENAVRSGFNKAIADVRRMFAAPEPEYKDGTVFWKEGTTIPIGIWAGGKMYTTNVPNPDRCCERDSDGDGNCDIHSSPGVFRNPQFNRSFDPEVPGNRG